MGVIFADRKTFLCYDIARTRNIVRMRKDSKRGAGMFLIVGLGNPGRNYEGTRHNVGFGVIDVIAEQENIPVLEKKHRAIIGKGYIGGVKAVLAKPQTFMNLSGESVRELAEYYKIDPERELIVISDDVSLEPGQIRIRKKGSAGGHNGLKNIIAHLGNDRFQRIRVGVGEKPAAYDMADYVLGHFTEQERKIIRQAQAEAAEAVRVILGEGADAAMNRFNQKKV